jgi:hypothetical protein
MYPIVFVSNDGVFFKVTVCDLSVSPFRELIKTARKMHVNETYTYILLRTSCSMITHVFSLGFVRYEVLNLPWNEVLSIIQNVVDIASPVEDLFKQWDEADKTSDPIDDFLDSIANEDIFVDFAAELDPDFFTNMDVNA